MDRPPRKAFGNFLCSIKYPKKVIPINSFSLVQAKTCVGPKILVVAALAGVEPRRTATRLRVGARLVDRTKTPEKTAA